MSITWGEKAKGPQTEGCQRQAQKHQIIRAHAQSADCRDANNHAGHQAGDRKQAQIKAHYRLVLDKRGRSRRQLTDQTNGGCSEGDAGD